MLNIKFKNARYQFGTYWAGPIFLLLGISYFVTDQTHHWTHYAYVFLGVSITLFLIFDKQADYMTIDNEQLIINGLLTKRVYLKDVTSFAINGDHLKIFKNSSEINIDISLITEASHTELISFLEKLKPMELNH
ncbi:hypothetical protein [Pedobacter chitinilyticus]|uniref:Uncharacterized protein n=1 Tax=Pedobacter chitinilyticus TaxID=2233776 RepID=A0A3S4RPA1_9SPHI|nr:hypothetical protein [Pedobacter chitinilyticus]RWU05671.1 hypothetical protein DPV69_16150 [Pedobacter chitinilyticus]